MRIKKYCVSKAVNHRTKKGGNGLDWSDSLCKVFDTKQEADDLYESLVSEFDFEKYTTDEYRYNICLYEPIVTIKGDILGDIGKMLKREKHVGSYFA